MTRNLHGHPHVCLSPVCVLTRSVITFSRLHLYCQQEGTVLVFFFVRPLSLDAHYISWVTCPFTLSTKPAGRSPCPLLNLRIYSACLIRVNWLPSFQTAAASRPLPQSAAGKRGEKCSWQSPSTLMVAHSWQADYTRPVSKLLPSTWQVFVVLTPNRGENVCQL